MMSRTYWLRAQSVAIATLLVVLAGNSASAVEPALGSISPYGVQRGTDAEITFGGARLTDAKEILFSRQSRRPPPHGDRRQQSPHLYRWQLAGSQGGRAEQ
jgi:hypothetical protein